MMQDIHTVHSGKLMYKIIHNQLPPTLIPQNTEIHRYSTRQVNNRHIKHRRTDTASMQIHC